MTNSFADYLNTDLFFVIGSNPTEAHPMAGAKIMSSLLNGTKLIVADPRRTELAEKADIWLQLRPGTDIPLLNGLMHIIIKEDLHDKKFIEERTEGFEDLKAAVEKWTPEKVSEITGVPENLLYDAARLYATTPKAMLCYTLGITEHVCGVDNVMSTANIAMLTGHLGKEGCGVNPQRGQNNVQGACDMEALPGASFAEKDGTFTNSERRVQRVRKAIEPIADTRPDWWITLEIAKRMVNSWDYTHPEQVFDEMAALTPSYGGINYERIENVGLQRPCPTKDHPGTPILHTASFTRGKGLFKAIDHTPPAEMPDEEYPYLLSTGRILYHYNVTTRNSSALDAHRPEEAAMIHPADAKALGVCTGDTVQVTSRREASRPR